MEACVLGAGSWGTALAILLGRNGHTVRLHGRSKSHLQSLESAHENLRYLPGFALPSNVSVAFGPEDLGKPDLWVIAVPAAGVRSTLDLVAGESPSVVIAAKGLEPGSGSLLSEVALEVRPEAAIAALSGPNLAVEIVRGIPTAAVAASQDSAFAFRVCEAFQSRTFRVYASGDVRGVELAGALKNVLAIGAGMSDGLGFGDNTKGALLARGLREMTLLGLALGGRIETFFGIAGVGDLFATASSRLSRNYRVGLRVGEGWPLAEAVSEIGQVAEGVTTADAALVHSRKLGVEMPVFEAIESVLIGRTKPLDAVGMLMERLPKKEDPLPK